MNPLVNDAVSTSESLSHYSDQVDTNERVLPLVVSLVLVSDTTTTSEAIGLVSSDRVAPSDTTTTSENTIVVIESPAAVSDSITSAENVLLLVTAQVAVADTTTTAEALGLNSLSSGVFAVDTVASSDQVTIFAAEAFDDVESLTMVIQPVSIAMSATNPITIDIVIE